MIFKRGGGIFNENIHPSISLLLFSNCFLESYYPTSTRKSLEEDVRT